MEQPRARPPKIPRPNLGWARIEWVRWHRVWHSGHWYGMGRAKNELETPVGHASDVVHVLGVLVGRATVAARFGRAGHEVSGEGRRSRPSAGRAQCCSDHMAIGCLFDARNGPNQSASCTESSRTKILTLLSDGAERIAPVAELRCHGACLRVPREVVTDRGGSGSR